MITAMQHDRQRPCHDRFMMNHGGSGFKRESLKPDSLGLARTPKPPEIWKPPRSDAVNISGRLQ